MELKHIEIERLTVSTANMRGKGKASDLSNILPSVRARGILVPLIVRPVSGDEAKGERGTEKAATKSSDTGTHGMVAAKGSGTGLRGKEKVAANSSDAGTRDTETVAAKASDAGMRDTEQVAAKGGDTGGCDTKKDAARAGDSRTLGTGQVAVRNGSQGRRGTEGAGDGIADGQDMGAGNGAQPYYEIVAGRRRYLSALAIAEEAGGIDPLPCAVIEAGDDAAALEASLIENVARLDPDEVTRWETFTRLVREGRTPEDIALTFGLTELQVKRTLSLGNLMPRIRNLYRSGEIDAVTVKHLTLASKAQQKEWLAMLDDPNAYCPCGSQLKAWLFGGMSIPTTTAIFDLASYDGEIVSDLFGEETYFASSDAFWAAQMNAVEMKAAAYREEGWSEVITLEPGQYFHGWEYERRSKPKGGKVYIAISHRGDVTSHEGYITSKEAQSARRQERGDAQEKPKRPELTAPLANYIDLHRHAVVRAKLAAEPSVALRLVLAHMIAGSCLWHVRVEPQRGVTDAIAESVETSPSETEFDLYRRAVLAALDFDADTPTVTGGYDGTCGISGLFVRLLSLSDEAVLDALAIVMGETLEAGSALIEALGRQLNIDMGEAFVADDTLLDLVKDREVLDGIVADVAGEEAAKANVKATGKVKRQIVADCLSGTNGRAKHERFVPRWMAFPPAAYTGRGGVGTVSRNAIVEPLFAGDGEADPTPDAVPQEAPGEAETPAVEPLSEAA